MPEKMHRQPARQRAHNPNAERKFRADIVNPPRQGIDAIRMAKRHAFKRHEKRDCEKQSEKPGRVHVTFGV